MNDFKINNVAEPVDLGDAATKQYVDTRFPSSSSWNLEGNTVIAAQRLGTKNDEDFAVIRNNETTAGIVAEGILMYKELDINSQRITYVPTPTDAKDVVTKEYVDMNSGWKISGNQLTNEGEIGSTNDVDVSFVRNNNQMLKLTTNGINIKNPINFDSAEGENKARIMMAANSFLFIACDKSIQIFAEGSIKFVSFQIKYISYSDIL
jgi:hypothetical protein